jgi:hypothetical protein
MVMDWQNQYCENGILLKASNIFNATPIKILITFFTEIENSVIMFIRKQKRPQKAKAILSRNRNTRDMAIHDFKPY